MEGNTIRQAWSTIGGHRKSSSLWILLFSNALRWKRSWLKCGSISNNNLENTWHNTLLCIILNDTASLFLLLLHLFSILSHSTYDPIAHRFPVYSHSPFLLPFHYLTIRLSLLYKSATPPLSQAEQIYFDQLCTLIANVSSPFVQFLLFKFAACVQ